MHPTLQSIVRKVMAIKSHKHYDTNDMNLFDINFYTELNNDRDECKPITEDSDMGKQKTDGYCAKSLSSNDTSSKVKQKRDCEINKAASRLAGTSLYPVRNGDDEVSFNGTGDEAKKLNRSVTINTAYSGPDCLPIIANTSSSEYSMILSTPSDEVSSRIRMIYRSDVNQQSSVIDSRIIDVVHDDDKGYINIIGPGITEPILKYAMKYQNMIESHMTKTTEQQRIVATEFEAFKTKEDVLLVRVNYRLGTRGYDGIRVEHVNGITSILWRRFCVRGRIVFECFIRSKTKYGLLKSGSVSEQDWDDICREIASTYVKEKGDYVVEYRRSM